MMMSAQSPSFTFAKGIAERIFLWADDVDCAGEFPNQGIRLLKESPYWGWFVSDESANCDTSLANLCDFIAILAEGCTSTALVYAMHSQQVAVVARHGSDVLDLCTAVSRGALLASVTSETAKGGELLRANASLGSTGEGTLVDREAPIVSYGRQADYLLVTMRRNEKSPDTDVDLVAVDARCGGISVTHPWDSLGMRGTCSVGMTIRQVVPESAIFRTAFRTVALCTMIPVGHLVWGSVWLGAAKGALKRLVLVLRERRMGAPNEAFLHRLGEIRLSLDLVDCIIKRVAKEVDLAWREESLDHFSDPDFTIRINNVKLAAARLTTASVQTMLAMGGLDLGYRRCPKVGLERVFRDLQSASLMFHDDRLLKANGQLGLVDTIFFNSGH